MKIEGRSVFIEGHRIQGAEVAATDLRAAAALILAGLAAEGMTRVTKLHHLDRGYVDFHEKLADLVQISNEFLTIQLKRNQLLRRKLR